VDHSDGDSRTTGGSGVFGLRESRLATLTSLERGLRDVPGVVAVTGTLYDATTGTDAAAGTAGGG
jgi:hypothetical protein